MQWQLGTAIVKKGTKKAASAAFFVLRLQSVIKNALPKARLWQGEVYYLPSAAFSPAIRPNTKMSVSALPPKRFVP